MRYWKFGICFLLAAFSWSPAHATPVARPGFNFSRLGELAIQNRGRIKPLDTFAMESLQFVTGRREWKGMSPVECVFGWLFNFDKEWEDEEMIRIDHHELKKVMGFEESKKYFSMVNIRSNEGLKKIIKEAMAKERNRERLTDLEKKAVQVQNQKQVMDAIMSGELLTLLPNPQGVSADWFPLTSLNAEGTLPYRSDLLERFALSLKDLIDGFLNNNAKQWNGAVAKTVELISQDLGKDVYPAPSVLEREIHYNHLRPFRLAWIFYAAGFIFLVAFLVAGKKAFKWVGGTFLGLGFLTHIYGFTIRCLISGRPPVTNMYESVIWVSWGCLLFSFLIWAAYKNIAVPAAASVFAVVGLILADNLPLALDPTINPLEPVLRSNYWLTIHVLTITLSYAAFALSLCLGNVVLGYYVFRPTFTAHIQQFSLYMYRAMQIGVVLLAAGTILGGVWADYSWGRFWGWDPKEVWALIALLLYLAVLHGRMSGWLKGFGFVATTVVSFLGVLMAWYGVNFVLGVGLHSYGFGTGGIGWVMSYVALQVGFIVLGYVKYQKARELHSLDTGIFPRKQ